jgi:hypothetical protein
MKKQLFLSVLLAFAIPCGQSQAQQGPMVITSDYYAGPKVLILHARNNSGRDIIAYTIKIRHKNPDGTLEQGGWSATGSEMLDVLITAQMAKDPTASESIRQRNIDDEAMNAAGHGIFVAGTTRDMTMNGIESDSELVFTAGMIFYGDGSFDKEDEDAFKQMLARRQGQLLAMKRVNEIVKNALADPTNDHPTAVALTEVSKYIVEGMARKQNGRYDPERDEHMYLQGEIQTLKNIPRKGTERELLSQYVEEQEKRIELMTPHCHLEIDLKK